MNSSVRWRYACDMFDGTPEWEAVNERDRKDVFDDVIFYVAKREKEEEKELRIRNRTLMLQVYNSMPSITYRTLWSEVCTYIAMHYSQTTILATVVGMIANF